MAFKWDHYVTTVCARSTIIILLIGIKKGFDFCRVFKEDTFYFKGLIQLCIKNSLLLKEENKHFYSLFYNTKL